VDFKADPVPDPDFYLNADPDLDPGQRASKSNSNPCGFGSTSLHDSIREFAARLYMINFISHIITIVNLILIS